MNLIREIAISFCAAAVMTAAVGLISGGRLQMSMKYIISLCLICSVLSVAVGGKFKAYEDRLSAYAQQIDQLEDATGKIFDHVIQHPEKQAQIRKFMIYYLPTTLKLLNSYDRMDATGISGENIDSSKERIETMMATIVSSFHKQLDALFRDEAIDIASDITVMENLLAQEGLTDSKTQE